MQNKSKDPSTEKEKIKKESAEQNQHHRKENKGNQYRRRKGRRVIESLLPLPLLSPTHPTPTVNPHSRRTGNNRTPFLLPKDMDTKVLSSFSIQELQHHILLLRCISLSNQFQHLLWRNWPIASFGLFAGRLVAFKNQSIVSNEVCFDVCPMMRPRVVVAVLLSVMIFTHCAYALRLIRIEARRGDIARKIIHLRMRILMPLTVLTPRKLLCAIRVFAIMHFSVCLDFLPAVFVCVKVLFCSFVVVESNRFVGVGEAYVFADGTTFFCSGHFASFFVEGGAGWGAVVERGWWRGFVLDVGGVEGTVECCRGHGWVFGRGRRVQDVTVVHGSLKTTPAR
jgi:hypothetical protein